MTPLAELEGEVHVWIVCTDTLAAPKLVEQYLPLLNHEERERYQRFHFDHDRLIYLAAHALARITLSRYAPWSPDQWRFVRGIHGKPEIEFTPGLPPLRFNLSHTQGMVACVVTLERDCGVDVENIRPMRDMRSMATMVFSDREIAYLETLAESVWPQNFFALWTLKEAYIKAIGLGFSAPLKQITFDIAASRVVAHLEAEPREDAALWLFERYSPYASHQLAVAAKQKSAGETIVYRQLDLTTSKYKRLRTVNPTSSRA